jgi:GT2 family glycosyltransferase
MSAVRFDGTARLGVVLVNYKRADDSIECLESLLRSTIPLRVVVVDNQSGDSSLARIADWAAGRLQTVSASPAMAGYSAPPLPKPIALTQLDAAAATNTSPATALTLIDAGRNGGFAAGNNIGLRHLLQDPALDYFWLLNNDTVVTPETAARLLARLDATPGIGMCGTMVRFYWQPDQVQALGGHSFSALTGNSRGLGAGQAASDPFDPAEVLRDTDFILGASLAVSRAFLVQVGLMEESYFLYFEELDWAARNAGRMPLGFADDAVVFHKEGGSIGSSGAAGQRSPLSEYWLARSRLTYMRRHAPLLLPWHWLLTLAVAVRRLMRRQPDKARAVIRALAGREY